MIFDFELKVEHFNFAFFMEADARIAAAVAAEGCPFCGGPLHVGNYQRKPRGGLIAPQAECFSLRHSLCCGRPGCRKRVLPPSLRFLGRRVYLEVVVVLASIVASPAVALCCAARACGVSSRTLKRWLRWWRESVPCAAWWAELRALLKAPPPDASSLPKSLVSHLRDGVESSELAMLTAQCLAPATTWLSGVARFVREAAAMRKQS